MAIQSKLTLKEWFKRGARPLASQFAEWMDSYWHKSEQFGVANVEGLTEELQQTKDDIRYLKSVESGSASLFNTDPAWEVEDFATLQSWLDANNHAHDTINDRDVNDFDVYLVTSENKEYFFDAGAWIPLAQAPGAPVEMSKVVAIDDTTLVVKLSAIPTAEVTANSFAVYDSATGDAVAVSAVAGGGVNYQITVERSKGIGLNFKGGGTVLIPDDSNMPTLWNEYFVRFDYIKNSIIIPTFIYTVQQWDNINSSTSETMSVMDMVGNTITINRTSVVKITYGKLWNLTTLSGNFMYGFTGLTQSSLKLPDMVTSIGNDFNTLLNIPLDLNKVKTIGNCFISNSSAFNQPINAPKLESIGDYCFYGYNGGSNGTAQATSAGSVAFNQPINAPKLESIGDYCFCGGNGGSNGSSAYGAKYGGGGGSVYFNQPINFPNLVSIGDYCFHGGNGGSGDSSGSPGGGGSVAFNQPINAPKLESIGNYCFCGGNSGGSSVNGGSVAFNQPINFPNLVSIGDYCFYGGNGGDGGQVAFNQDLILPASLTHIGNYFLYNVKNYTHKITIETNATPPTDNYTLSTFANTDVSYQLGINIAGSGAAAWKSALPNRTSTPFRKLIIT